jgi:hypothetical protein
MNFLEKVKDALSSKTAEAIESDLAAAAPDIATAAATIALNPASAVIALAQLFEKELARVEGIANAAKSTAETTPASAANIPEGAAEEFAEAVFAAIAPKLEPYAQIIGVLAQHFPALRDIQLPPVATPVEPADNTRTPAA